MRHATPEERHAARLQLATSLYRAACKRGDVQAQIDHGREILILGGLTALRAAIGEVRCDA